MRNIKVQYLALVALPLYVACAASDESEPPDNNGGKTSAGASTTAGTTSTAGTPGVGGTPGAGGAGTAGTPGASGSGTAGSSVGTAGSGTAGTPGTAGSGTGGTGAGSCPAPMATSGMISTFDMANASNQLTAGTDVWSASPLGATATAMGGVLHVASTTGSWASVSTLLNKGAMCINVDGKYTGIKFKISSPTNTSIKFIVVTPETKADSSHYGKVLTVTATPTDTPVLFAELTKPTFGAGMLLPTEYKPAQHLVGIGFGVMEEKTLMDITIDDVTLY